MRYNISRRKWEEKEKNLEMLLNGILDMVKVLHLTKKQILNKNVKSEILFKISCFNNYIGSVSVL